MSKNAKENKVGDYSLEGSLLDPVEMLDGEGKVKLGLLGLWGGGFGCGFHNKR